MLRKSPSRRDAIGLAAAGTLAGLLPAAARAATMSTVHYAMQKVPEDFVYRAKDWAKPYGVRVISSVSPSAVRSHAHPRASKYCSRISIGAPSSRSS